MEQKNAVETYEQKQAREYAKNEVIAKRRRAVLVKVAEALGYIVEKDPEENERRYWNAEARVRAKMLDGSLFFGSCGGYRTPDRYFFSTDYPRPSVGEISTYDLPRPSITCAETKTEEQLISDIKRRLLPDFERGLKIVQERIKQTTDYHSARDLNLSKVMGRKLTDEEKKSGNARLPYDSGKPWGDVKSYNDSVSIELSNLSPDLAARILTMVKEA